MTTEVERFRQALKWIAVQTLPAPSGGNLAETPEQLAQFAELVLAQRGDVPNDDCPYCRGDGFGCPVCSK